MNEQDAFERDARSMDSKTLKQAFHDLERAYQECRLEEFREHFDLAARAPQFLPDFGRAQTMGEFLSVLEFAMSLPGAGWILAKELRAEVHGDVGVVTYTFSAGDEGCGRGTRLFRWMDGRWKCFHSHLSTGPDVTPPHF